jgi:amino acid transporter
VTATPELSTPTRPARSAGRWLAGATVAFAAGIAATSVAIAAQHVDDLRRQQCEHLFRRITAAMPGYALPLAIAGAMLVAVAAVLALVGYRRAAGATRVVAGLLVVLTVLGTMFALWLGVYAIHADIPIEPTHCVG